MNDPYGAPGGKIQIINDLTSSSGSSSQIVKGIENSVSGMWKGITGTASMMKYMPFILIGVLILWASKK